MKHAGKCTSFLIFCIFFKKDAILSKNASTDFSMDAFCHMYQVVSASPPVASVAADASVAGGSCLGGAVGASVAGVSGWVVGSGSEGAVVGWVVGSGSDGAVVGAVVGSGSDGAVVG